MKKAIPFSLLFICLISANAQSGLSLKEIIANAKAEKSPATSFNKTDAAQSRLIAFAAEQWNGNLWDKTDSSVFSYSGNKGGDWNDTMLPLFSEKTDYTFFGGYWQRQSKALRTYNTADRVTEEVNMIYSNAVWENESKVLYTYNNSKLTEKITQDWLSGDWENVNRYAWIFDNQGNELQYDEEQWDGADWAPLSRRIKVYDANNRLLTDTLFFESAGNLVENELLEYTYATNGNLLTQTSLLWNGSDWDFNYRFTYTYDGNNNAVITFYETYISNAWVANYKLTRTFNAAKNPTTMLREIWNGSAWANHSRFTYTYNANNKETESERESWISGSWQKTLKTTRQYTAGNLADESQFSWSGSAWDPISKKSWTYNSYNQRTTYNYQLGSGATLENYLREFYYYELFDDNGTIGIADVNTVQSSAYPNPLTKNTIISFDALKDENVVIVITDINGKVVYRQSKYVVAGENSLLWDASSNDSGIYFYEIKGKANKGAGKLVKL